MTLLNIFLFMMIMITLCMFQTTHPLILAMFLFMQIILGAFTISIMTFSSWISFMLILIMISGLMIIFIYMTSICTNSKFFSFPKHQMMYLILILPMITHFFNMKFSESYFIKDMVMLEYVNLYLKMNMWTSLFLFIYLLMMLIFMINILYKNKSPMRKKY